MFFLLVTPRAGVDAAWSWSGGQPEGFVWRGVHASYLGLHWAGVNTRAVTLFVYVLSGATAALAGFCSTH